MPKKFIFSLLLLLLPSPASAEELKTAHEKTLYSLGLSIGSDIAVFKLKPEELRFITLGMQDTVEGKTPKVSLSDHRPQLMMFLRGRRDSEARAFLARTAKEEGVVRSPSGLLYKELAAGSGPSPSSTDTIKVHYHGTLTDGGVFDTSRERGPSEFPLNRLIRCWREGVPMMKVGGKAKLFCPAELAYGEQGSPLVIKPGAVLIFEVELLGIVP